MKIELKKLKIHMIEKLRCLFSSFDFLKKVLIFLSVFPLSFLLVKFLIYSELINFFLISKADKIGIYTHWFLSSILFLEFVFVILIFKNNYRFSFWQHYITVFLSIFFFILNHHQDNWYFIQFFCGLSYLSLMVLTLIGIVIIQFFRRIFSKLKIIFEKKTLNYFIEDKPLISDIDTNTFSKIEHIIFHDKYQTSFTVGLVGPWGTGKSSIMESLKVQVENHKKRDIIQFSFSPFLNHNEDQIITDFFTQLSNVLKIKDGSLSNLLLNYAGRLTNVFRDKNALSWFKPAPSTSDQETAGELYAKIKNIIIELDFKLIIYIDDLDRLTSKETYNVLKLIRNTSNFPNTVFFVALDKEFSKKAIKEHLKLETDKFIDKFFQLEIFIPFPEKDMLFAHFNKLKDRFKSKEENYKLLEEIEIVLKNEILTLNDSFNNYRDVVFLINIIIADFDFLLHHHRDILLDEYLLLCILKKKCPEVFNILGTNYEMILNEKHFDEGFVDLDDLHNDTLNNKVNLTLKGSDEISAKSVNIDQNSLAILNLLFTKNEKPQSIKFIENFNLLIHQYPRKELFSSKELFEFIENPKAEDDEQIQIIINSDKYQSFIRKIENFEPNSKVQLFKFGEFVKQLLIHTDIRLYKIIYKYFTTNSNYVSKYNVTENDIFTYFDSLFSNFKIDYPIKKDLIIFENSSPEKDKIGLNENNFYELSKYLIKQYFLYPEPFNLREKTDLFLDISAVIKSKKQDLFKFVLQIIDKEINLFISLLIQTEKNNLAYSIDPEFFNLFMFDQNEFNALVDTLEKVQFNSKDKFLEFLKVLHINGNSPILNFPFNNVEKTVQKQASDNIANKQFLCKFNNEKDDFSNLFVRASITNVNYIVFKELNNVPYLFVMTKFTEDYSGLYNVLTYINTHFKKDITNNTSIIFEVENEKFQILLNEKIVFEVIQTFG